MNKIKKMVVFSVSAKMQAILVGMLMLFANMAFAAKPEPTIYNEDDTTIQVTAQHPEFTIQLKSNPTTGYAWFLREYSTKMIIPLKHSFIAPEKKLIGASGLEQWTFKVSPDAFLVPQMLTIRMIYARPWKSTDASTQVVFHIMTRK